MSGLILVASLRLITRQGKVLNSSKPPGAPYSMSRGSKRREQLKASQVVHGRWICRTYATAERMLLVAVFHITSRPPSPILAKPCLTS